MLVLTKFATRGNIKFATPPNKKKKKIGKKGFIFCTIQNFATLKTLPNNTARDNCPSKSSIKYGPNTYYNIIIYNYTGNI